MMQTTIFEKGVTSVFNAFAVFIMFIPFYIVVDMNLFEAKLLFSYLFFLYNFIPLAFKEKRDWGMVIMKTYWKKDYGLSQHFIYSVLYTLSFSTLLFWIYFPLDIFLFNILVLQLPSILLTGTTLHGLLSGKMETVKK